MPIKLVEKEQASPEVRQIYDEIEARAGRNYNLYKLLAHKPDALRTLRPFESAALRPGSVSGKLKQLIWQRVSILNGCEY